MNLVRKYRVLIIIVLVGGLLRFWQLGAVPASPDWDEASLGWNAYSILKTGKDEYGTFLPLTFRSFGDYKPPLYVYLTVPFVAVFGLDTWVVRLPSAILGTSAIIAVFFFMKELLVRQRKEQYDEIIPFIVSFLLALSPWHIQFSRVAFEANIGLSLTLWAVTCFFWSKKRPWLLSISAFVFGLTIYAYHTQRIFSPLLVLILVLTFWKTLIKQKKAFAWAGIIGVITVIPLLPILTDKTALQRLQGTTPLATNTAIQTALLEKTTQKLARDKSTGNALGLLFDNRRVVFLQKIVEGYLSHYSLNWFFVLGDNARHHAPDMGLMYLWELPFFLYGLYYLGKRGGSVRTILLGWFLIAPIAASPTTDLPHAVRSLVFLPIPQILTTFGIVNAWKFFYPQHLSLQRLAKLGFGIVVMFFLVRYFDLYFVQMNKEYSEFWQYGYKEAVLFAKEHHNEYNQIVVSTKLEQPYMFFLYFLHYDPKIYHKEGRNAFDIYSFRPIVWANEPHDGKTLFIGTPSEIQGDPLTIVHFLNGKEVIKIAR